MSWLKTKFPAIPIREIDIEYFRDLESDIDFQKQKMDIIYKFEQDVDYYVLQIMYAHIGNIKHISEFTQIMNQHLFRQVRCFRETLDSYVEGFDKMKKNVELNEKELPPVYPGISTLVDQTRKRHYEPIEEATRDMEEVSLDFLNE